ncbi:cellulose synthase/poly-beta-1,6-N-acetylglucosamine synthase-like glycosyltransferase [Sphingomonas sp. BE138]|uniref:glycosyltransferase family 2 protein n=1 Tax=Sphingomonas sp. BE138 TaxID=2817845 RepID=UPI00285EC851|nr:glycosyltransferase family 2 protein [Sphingomonas sp. BE138]MDR6788463.1 cellulose synthase/poly-beta-1,6-N-acetylglucosamine synthase-like glycosyltransferase [Sphingomonas sp. BE138]
MSALGVIATVVAAALAAPLIVMTATFAVEVIAGLRGTARTRGVATDSCPGTVIVMPAHDEATIIAATLARLMPELPPACRVLVVADNCADDTAAIAAQGGAEVLRRDDPVRRGKGFALAYARDHLADAPPDVVMVLDADGSTDRASIATMARAATQRPVQAVNLLSPDLSAAPMVQVSNFAFVIKNLVRQRGLWRLAGRVNLTGTGMAFPWAVFRDAGLATADIVEDLALGLELARRGQLPGFVADATVWSAASSAEGTLKQRTRWEGGFLATSRTRALPAIGNALRSKDFRALWAGLSLAVPPLTLLLLLDIAGLVVLGGLMLLGASAWPLLLLGCLLVVAISGLGIAWMRVGRPFLSGGAAIRLPLYVLWKIPLYLGLARKRPTGWLRAGR